MSANEQDTAKEKKINKAKEGRNVAVTEIRTSESSYLANIEHLSNFLVTMSKDAGFMKSTQGQEFITEMQKLTGILVLSKSLYSAIKKAAPPADPAAPGEAAPPAPDPDMEELNKAFVEHAPHLKNYNEYMASYSKISALCGSLRKNNTAFQELMTKFGTLKQPSPGNQPLENFLIMPVQRLPRYKMLLEEAKKRQDTLGMVQGSGTGENNPLYKGLEGVEAAATAGNEAIRKQDKITEWTVALSKGYNTPENRKLRTTTKDGNLSTFTENDLKVLQANLNNKLNMKYGTQDSLMLVKCNFKKKPLVIDCLSDTKPPIILYKIIQSSDKKHFDIEIQKDLSEFAIKSSKGKTLSCDYNAMEKELGKREVVSQVFEKMLTPKLAPAVKTEPSPIVAAIPVAAAKESTVEVLPTTVAVPAPSAAQEPEQKPSIEKPTAAKAGLADVKKELSPKKNLQEQLKAAQNGLRKTPVSSQPVKPQLAGWQVELQQKKAAAAAKVKETETPKPEDNTSKRPSK